MTKSILLLAVALTVGCNRETGVQKASYSADRASVTLSDPAQGPPPQSYADVVDKASAAVVTIRSSRRVRAPQQFPFAEDPFLRRFFGAPNQEQQPGQIQRGLGSGVIVTADGHILTNHHVIDGAEQITVELPSRQTRSARLIGSDSPSDLALLKIDDSNLPILKLGDSNRVRVGDICLALGNPLGIGETVTAGIISAKGRSTGLSDGAVEDFLQTDAPINQGNSGGALINTRAELIGINSQILSPSGGNIGIGFAIPSNMARDVMAQLVKGGRVKRGLLGVGIQQVTSDLATSLGLKEVRGVLIGGVTPGGPAERAGLKPGDVILAVNGQPVNNPNELRNRIASSDPGTQLTLTYFRGGKESDAKVMLGELTPEAAANKQSSGGKERGANALGLSVDTLTPDDAAQLGLPRNVQGVLVQQVDPVGAAAEAGILPGDVVVEVNRQPVRSPADFRAALNKSGSQPALLLINRKGNSHFLTVRPR